MNPVEPKTMPAFNIEEVREKLAAKKGKQYWRALEELSETPEFQAWVEDEFPNRKSLAEIDRRSMLKFMGASLALAGLAGCRSLVMDEEKIVPYVKQPEDIVPGEPLYYASAFTMQGYAKGVLVEQHEGRPTKIEGNPDHPASLGATDIFMQASLLDLYDPDRLRNVMQTRDLSTWAAFWRSVRSALETADAEGKGVRILTENITSPTVAAYIGQLQAKHPSVKWHQYEPTQSTGAYLGNQAMFGTPLNTYYDLSNAARIVTLDAEFLVSMPGSLKYARQFANGRRIQGTEGDMNRLYAFESMPTVTGASADHRFVVKPSEVEGVARAIATRLGISGAIGGSTSVDNAVIDAVVRDLQAFPGRSVVIPGDHQPTAVHALAHAINGALGNVGQTVFYTDPVEAQSENHMDSLRNLVAEMAAGQVDMLLILGGNPVYSSPSDIDFAGALKNVRYRVHHTYHFNETSKALQAMNRVQGEEAWILPDTHFLEAWGDARAFDGTLSIQQPLIHPIFQGKSILEVVAGLGGDARGGQELLKAFHGGPSPSPDFDKTWRRWLHQGMVPNSAFPTKSPAIAGSVPNSGRGISGLEVMFVPDPTIFDGRFANNGWLQECPKQITKITWDNVIHMNPKMLQGHQESELVELTVNGRTIVGAAWPTPGHPEGAVTVTLGYGRTEGGTIAEGQAQFKPTGDEVREPRGYNANLIRSSNNPGIGTGDIKWLGRTMAIATTQVHHTMTFGTDEPYDILRTGDLEEFKRDGAKAVIPEHTHNKPEHTLKQNLYPDQIFSYNGPQWGMTIDMNTCIGCNACVIACQAENNIPVVGKEEVARGREMHWLRIDRYYASHEGHGDVNLDNPEMLFQPMMCVHCEKAPCEPVCPVAATLHSHEGLNQMVYNRCVGTRYCSNNCPYKVRRFNYYNYSDNQEQFNTQIPPAARQPKAQGIELLKMVNNPDVTVRGRGIMEKCTYCIQRINEVRIEAKKLGRDPKDGEIITACQQACPTRTIVFGNIADEKSEVSKWRVDPRAYRVLEEVQTRPRTSHLARLRNTNKEILA
jgi:MoCo/4Fe-4S cofactor protein with predicted Tat translocation signal